MKTHAFSGYKSQRRDGQKGEKREGESVRE